MADARALISLSVRSYIICAPHHPPSSDPRTYLLSGTDGHQQTEREFRLSLCASHSHPWREQQHQSCASYIHGSDHIIRAGEVSRVDLSISRLLRGRLFCGQSETIVPPSCPSAQTQCSFRVACMARCTRRDSVGLPLASRGGAYHILKGSCFFFPYMATCNGFLHVQPHG